MALAPMARTTTVTIANPTPPTNVAAQYQGSPPTLPGLTPPVTNPTVGGIGGPVPDVAEANIYKFADPGIGALATGGSANTGQNPGGYSPPYPVPPVELTGLAEGDGTEAVINNPAGTDATNNWSSQRATDGNVDNTKTPNAQHPSFNTRAK